jgi:hypothetical protein
VILRGGRCGQIGRAAALGTDAVQKNARRFVGRILRHEFAAERLGEDGLVVVVDDFEGARCFGGETVDPPVDTAPDFVRLVNGEQPAKAVAERVPFSRRVDRYRPPEFVFSHKTSRNTNIRTLDYSHSLRLL